MLDPPLDGVVLAFPPVGVVAPFPVGGGVVAGGAVGTVGPLAGAARSVTSWG